MRQREQFSQGGFSLVELMVGIAVGLVLISAVVALAVSMLRTNAESITSARLTQEGRALGDVFARELKRARYSGNYLAFVGSGGAAPNQFGAIDILNLGTETGSCIRFAYDADDDGALDANEVKVFTLVQGAVYFAQYATYAAATCSSSGALRLSSPEVQVTSLVFNRTTTGASPSPNRIDVTFRLALGSDATINRRFDQTVQVRNPYL